MDKTAFLQRLRRGAERYGIKPEDLTPRLLKDLVDEHLLQNPMPGGRKRVWGGWRQYRRALQICRLKSQGVERHTDLRWQLWMMGANITFSRPRRAKFKDVRESIIAEFDRRRTQPLQRMPTAETKRPRDGTILRHMGSASPGLMPDAFAYSPTELAVFYDAMFFPENAVDLNRVLERVLDAFGLPALAKYASDSGIEMPDVIKLGRTVLIGMGGDPELLPGDTAIDTIKGASEETFANAREVVRLLLWGFENLENILSVAPPDVRALGQTLVGPYVGAARTIERKANPWKLLFFVAVLRMLEQEADKGRQMAFFARDVVPKLRQIFEKASGNSAA